MYIILFNANEIYSTKKENCLQIGNLIRVSNEKECKKKKKDFSSSNELNAGVTCWL